MNTTLETQRIYNDKSSNRRYVDIEKQLRLKNNEIKKLRETNRNLKLAYNKLKKETYIENLNQQTEPYILKVKEIINSKFFVDIDMPIRNIEVVSARNMYYAWCRQNTAYSYKRISATLLTNHDHSTIIHSINEHEKYMSLEKKYKEDYLNVCELVKMSNHAELVINPS